MNEESKIEQPLMHDWPEDPQQHKFGPWMVKDKRHHYRKCIDPECPHFEVVESK